MESEPAASGVRRSVRVGKYEVLRHLATGGMGVVYKARDTELGREVALKVLGPDVAARPGALERFRQEARHAARLRHENIVTLYEFGEAQGTFFLALELVEGTDLDDLIAEKGRLDPEEACQILLQAAQALDYVHAQGMVHRDVKPSNFLLAQSSGRLVVKLTDLGLAREVSDEEYRITRVGSTVGSIDYMSPEQARDSRAADIRSDIYSLGCTFFHMLAGQPPFGEGGLTERLFKHIEAEPPDVRTLNPNVPPRLVKILGRMLAKKAAQRYQTPAELIADLTGKGEPAEPLPAAAEEPAAPRPRRRRGTPTKITPAVPPRERRRATPPPTPDPDDVFPLTSPEQRRAAAGQFERAAEVIASANYEYGIPLLASCCKLDPANLRYRQVLRQTQKAKHGNRPAGNPLTWLKGLPAKARLKAAKQVGDHLRVLELGEDLLSANPWHVGTQMDMAAAADALGLLNLAVWLLEEARQHEHGDVPLQRALARLYEKQGKLSQALAAWSAVRKAVPDDGEAYRKTHDLAAHETIVRGGYQEQLRKASERE